MIAAANAASMQGVQCGRPHTLGPVGGLLLVVLFGPCDAGRTESACEAPCVQCAYGHASSCCVGPHEYGVASAVHVCPQRQWQRAWQMWWPSYGSVCEGQQARTWVRGARWKCGRARTPAESLVTDSEYSMARLTVISAPLAMPERAPVNIALCDAAPAHWAHSRLR